MRQSTATATTITTTTTTTTTTTIKATDLVIPSRFFL